MNKRVFILALIISLLFWAFIFYQLITTYQAHETFAGYCAWRGLQVVNQSADYGYCKDINSGQVYKMVLFNGRWYLDGDLPNNWPF